MVSNAGNKRFACQNKQLKPDSNLMEYLKIGRKHTTNINLPHLLPSAAMGHCMANLVPMWHRTDVALDARPTGHQQCEYLFQIPTHLYHYQNWTFELKHPQHVEIQRNSPSQPKYLMNQLASANSCPMYLHRHTWKQMSNQIRLSASRCEKFLHRFWNTYVRGRSSS